MIKACQKIILLTIIISLLLNGCKKGSDKPADNTFIVSPKILIDMLGKNWNDEVEPEVTGKRGYLYSPITTDPQINAVITLAAYDTSNGLRKNCSLLLNIAKTSNHVTAVSMNTVDSLSPLSIEQAYSIEKYYYYSGLQNIKDTFLTYPFYENTDQVQVKTTLEDLLAKLNSNYETNTLGITSSSKSYYITIDCYKNTENARRVFIFNGFGH